MRSSKPWVVLVTGLNGIRKTTSVHQPWFKELLRQALGTAQFADGSEELPAGGDSFFRQLDYMIATMALEQFRTLYEIGGAQNAGPNASADTGDDVDADTVALYATFKEAIFARYRTVAEILGVLLVKACQAKGMNVMVETSGRDVGMYKYIDHLFPEVVAAADGTADGTADGAADGAADVSATPSSRYRKLVVNFAINDIGFAERSVDSRMQREIKVGRRALSRADAEPAALIRANAGGPYGSAVLAGVQADSRAVWRTISEGSAEGGVGQSWYKAAIAIDAAESSPWQARPLPRDEGAQAAIGTFDFGPPPDQADGQ